MTNLSKFQQQLAALGADAAIISSSTGTRYLSGFDYTDGFLLICPERAYLLADFRYIEDARATVSDFEIIMPEGDMLSELSLLLATEGAVKVAIEEDSVSCAQMDNWKQKFEKYELIHGASKTLRELRIVKSESEIAKMIKAQSITDAAFEHILGFITPERTELEVALELEFFMRSMGAESVAFNTIAVSGASSSLPHGVPQNKKLSRGFFTMDFGAKWQGYCSDMTRTVVIGKADDEIKKVYNTVLAAQLAALEGICEGMKCRDADALARKVIDDAGYGKCFGHSLGHGVGLDIHEAPSLSPRAKDDSVLTRGNVVTVEPGIYLAGRFGVRIEDMIAVSDDGSIYNFTESPKEMIVI